MNYVFAIFVSILFTFSIDYPLKLQAELQENQVEIPKYLKDLEELGYCIIPSILSADETRILYERVWNEYVEKAWPECKMDDRSNWATAFPIQVRMGVFAGPAGQTQVMWDLRQDPRIVDVFAKLWNTEDLIVSMDGLSIMCPPDIRDGCVEPWPHVDQKVIAEERGFTENNEEFVSESLLKTKPFTVQGQFLFEDSADGDGGFYCVPKSHLRFNEFAPELDAISGIKIDSKEKREAYTNSITKFIDTHVDDIGNPYEKLHVTAPKGSLILWDSRTVHWNQHPDKNRVIEGTSKVRMVGYLCYVPKARLTEKGRLLRKEAFENGVSTGHNPCYPMPRYSKNVVYQEYKHFLESEDYIQPELQLTELGKSLLGF